MKLKYYLRGLGIGIIVTAVVMGVASGNRKETLSDREIIERAAELGMVEQGSSLADLKSEEEPVGSPEAEKTEKPVKTPESEKTEEPVKTPESEKTEEPVKTPEAEKTERPVKTPEPEKTEEPVKTEAPVKTPEPEKTKEPSETPKGTPSDAVVIEVRSGDSSYTVCQRLQEKGLVASASEFDTFLCTKGYDRKLRAGSYEIPSGATDEEIAGILIQSR